MICFLLSVGAAAVSQPALPLGTWVVTRPPASVSNFYGAADPIPYQGKEVLFASDSVVLFFSRDGYPPFQERPVTCLQPDYEWGWEREEVFYQVNDERLGVLLPGVADSLQVLRVECIGQNAGATFYAINDDWWLLAYRGLFCYLARHPEPASTKKRCWWPFRRKKRD